MRRAEERGDLTFIGIRHEGAAAFAASAYGKLTGRPAACFAIAGPGSTNLLTGLYDAKVDRAPVLALSGQVPSKVLGRGAFQDLDLAGRVRRRRRVRPRRCSADSDHAELMTLAVQARARASAASRTSCCPTRCRCCRRPTVPVERTGGPRRRSPRRAAGGDARRALRCHRRGARAR